MGAPERSDAPPVAVELHGAVGIVRLQRPEVRNAVNAEVACAVEAALDDFEARSIRAAVVTGDGPAFCAGADLRMISEGRSGAMTERGGFAGITGVRRGFPLIAAVEGPALAGGCEIVLACDLVVAGRSATFGIPEVLRGLVAGAGGVVRLPHRIPRNIAMEVALTGEPLDAPRAHALGLVNRLVADGEALDTALDLAQRIAANPAVAVDVARHVVDVSATLGEAAGWAANDEGMRRVQASEDFHEGPRAFLEKRPPRWTHR